MTQSNNENTNRPVKAAISGFGRWGMNLHEASLASSLIDITHVVTRSPQKVMDYCAQHNLRLTDDYQQVLQTEEVEAVIIVTPHTQHYIQIQAAAAAGKHVFCEKPFALDADEAERALDTLSAKHLKVAIGHNRRFAGNTIALKSLLRGGTLGDIVHMEGTFSAPMAGSRGTWRDSRIESPAGGMTSLGIHVVDMFLNLAGPMKSLSAQSRQINIDCDFDDNTIVNLDFTSGARGVLTTLTSTSMQWRITVYGTKGWAELREQDELLLQLGGEPLERLTFDGFDYPAIKSIQGGLDAFAIDVRGGAAFPISPADILHGTRVLQSVVESAEANGKLITF